MADAVVQSAGQDDTPKRKMVRARLPNIVNALIRF